MVIDPRLIFERVASINHTMHEAVVVCPYHDDTKPSATFNTETGLFFCFACHTGKNFVQLIADLGIDIKSLDVELSDDSKRVTEELLEDWRYYMTFPYAYDNLYLKSRLVDNDLVDDFGIRAWKHGIIFPQKDSIGSFCGVQLRYYKGGPKYKFVGSRGNMWPQIEELPAWLDQEVLYVTEGIFGALRAISAGLRAVSVMSSANLINSGVYLQGFNVVVVFDDDEAGWQAAAKGIALGFRVACPTFEADSMTVDGWQNFHENYEKLSTSNLTSIAHLTIDPTHTIEKVVELAKWTKSWKGGAIISIGGIDYPGI